MITETRNIQQSSMMLFHTDGKCLKPHLRTLRLLGFTLLLTYFCRGQSQLIGSPIIATLGNDIILPCQLEPVEDATDLTLEWTRSDLDPRFVHVWRSGKELVSKKHKSFEGRTSLFLDELMFGNISLKLSKVKLADRGTYRCFIPALDRQSFVQLDVGAVSSPVISLAGTDKGGAVLQCQCKDWYPEPEVLWLDSEGNLLSAGPTGTVRGPDDLYTVSSRVTVEKRPSNSFTCRVQQKNINQTRETAILILDDFFELQSSYSSTITGLAVSLAVFVILFILLLLFSVWKWRKNKTKTERSAMSETVKGEEKKRTEDQFVTEEEMKPLKGNGENKSKRSAREKKQQKKKEAEKQDQTKKLNDKNKEKVQDHKSSQSKSQDYSLTSPASQDSATGRVIVDEVDLKGTYARLSNTSNQDQPMGGWELHVHVNNKKPIKYTFEQKFKLEARKTVTIWAGESDVKQDTANMVGFSKTYWGSGEQLVVYLYSKTGELEASKMMQLGNSQKYQENNTCVTSLDSDKGHIVVDEVDLEGKYVRLSNKSKTDQQIKNWELYLNLNNKKPNIYTFPNSLNLKAGETVKIWASRCGVNKDTSTDLVWKGQKPWGTGEQLLVSLYSCNGELEARKILEGRIIVNEVDPEGKYVRLTNKSNKNKPLGGWELHLQINNRKPSMFTSFYSFILKAGETVTIWASGCNGNHNPSTDLVWKDQTPCGTGKLLVSLYCHNGELEASKMLEPEKSQGQLGRQTSQGSAKGRFTLEEVDPEGKRVCLSNASNEVNCKKSWSDGDQLLIFLYSDTGEEMATKKVDGKMNSDLQT